MAVINDAIEVILPSAAAKRISIDFVPPDEPCLLVADSERLQQVLSNLLSNAVKFTDPGGTVFVTIDRHAATLVLCVRDTGRGINPEFLPYVFDRFKQADGSTTRRVAGLGLGLAIVRHIVELHGGQVRAESEGQGRGASLKVTLPIRAVTPTLASSEGPGATPERSAQPASLLLSGVRVLVVDDEQDARELLETVLIDAGAVVETADSAAAGLSLMDRTRPHVLVSDIGMPNEDGYTFIQRIRAVSVGPAVPSIALTAYARAEDKAKALAAGFTLHMGKPVNGGDLVAAVANLAHLGPPPQQPAP